MTLSRLIARPMLASIFVVGGVNALKNAPKLAAKAAPVTDELVAAGAEGRATAPLPEDPVTLVRLNAARPDRRRPGPGHRARLRGSPRPCSPRRWCRPPPPGTGSGRSTTRQQRNQQQLHFFKNVSLLGGLLIAAGDTEGKPGVAWRARRAAKDARREARHLAAPPGARPSSRRRSSPEPPGAVTVPADPWPAPRATARSTRSSRCPAASR